MKPTPSITNQDHSDEDKKLNPELPEQTLTAKNAPKKQTSKKKEPTKIEKEAKAIGNKVLDEGVQFGNQAKDIVLGTGKESEPKKASPLEFSEKELKYYARQVAGEEKAMLKSANEYRRDMELENIRKKKLQKSKRRELSR